MLYSGSLNPKKRMSLKEGDMSKVHYHTQKCNHFPSFLCSVLFDVSPIFILELVLSV